MWSLDYCAEMRFCRCCGQTGAFARIIQKSGAPVQAVMTKIPAVTANNSPMIVAGRNYDGHLEGGLIIRLTVSTLSRTGI